MSPVLADTGVFGFRWDLWTAIGLVGSAVFASRFVLQWIVSEVKGRSVVPVSFWWLSIAGSILQAAYFIHLWDLVGMVSFVPNSLIYCRNLWFIRRQRLACPSPPGANS